ncbi:hypothetical protein [Halorussus salinisoli]|uniref:hypothetical protein n=1 Tax=Halorussus salinisoli TaxID=2558242 RepID=UPI0010C1EF96|nr:hypothetical protein [Halorussus salinisoli]
MVLSQRIRFAFFPISIAIILYLIIKYVKAKILLFPLFTVVITSILFLLFLIIYGYKPSRITLRRPKLVDTMVFLLIISTLITGRIGENGIVDWYYLFAAGTAGILLFRIISEYISIPIQLAQIVLFSLTLRATVWFSFPVYGRDTFHHAATGYIVSKGKFVPETITYYANFPHAHTFAAVYTIITGNGFKAGYFSLGIAIALSILGVYLVGRYVLQSKRGGLLSAFFISVAAYHIRSGGEPFAQALFTALVPFILYLFLIANVGKRKIGLLMFLSLFSATIQNIAPLILSLSFLLFMVLAKVSRFIPYSGNRTRLEGRWSIPTSIVGLVAICGLYYYIISDYLIYQVKRVISVILFLQNNREGVNQETLSGSGSAGVPTIELFGQELPGFIMWAAPLLITGGIICFSLYTILFYYISNRDKFIPLVYLGFSILFFIIFSITFASNTNGSTRALPYIFLLISPIFGWLVINVQSNSHPIVNYFIILLAILVALSGMLTPIVAKAELTQDEFQPYLRSNQVSSIEFASSHTDKIIADYDAAGHEEMFKVRRGDGSPNTVFERVLYPESPSSHREFRTRSHNGETTLFFSYYKNAYSIVPPDTNKVYSTGYATIYTG